MNDPEVISLADLARVPAERAASAVPWAGAVVWTAAEIMHWAAWPGMTFEAATVAVAAFGITFGLAAHRGWDWRAPLITAAFAAWLVIASAAGPLDGFHVPPLTVVWAVLTGILWKVALGHPAIAEAQRWRAKRAEWLAVRHAWHLPGSHLLAHEGTRLGEQFTVDVRQTGELASHVARDPALPERIAMDRGIPRTRVTVDEGTPAGRVVIDIRDRDPWAEPVPHPLLSDEPQASLREADAAVIDAIRDGSPRSVKRPVPVGQDPATGRILTVPLWDEHGSKNVSIVGIKGAGKGVLLNCISESVTAAPDALMIRVNVSKKGAAEARAWGPACHLTAFGPEQASRALKVLRCVNGIIDWRARQPRDTDVFVPSAADPLIVLMIDEILAAMKYAKIRAELEAIASTGRELGVTAMRAGQRGTAQWTGGSDVRSQDDVFCLGMVNRSNEMMHAAGEMGLRMPDMATYGEGHPGVWAIGELGEATGRRGRTWKLSQPADIARIAQERAHSQPDLPAACKEFLGEEYRILLGTDVYARWARGHSVTPVTAPPPHGAPGGARLAEEAAVPVATIQDDPTVRLDWDMDEDMKARFAAVDKKATEAKRILAETQAMDKGPAVPEDKLKESSEARWAMLAEDTEIPPQMRERLLDLLSGDGLSGRKITEALAAENPEDPPKRAWVMAWLNRLRWERVAYVHDKGPLARWRLTAESGDGS